MPLKTDHFDAWMISLRLTEPESLFFYDCHDTIQDGVLVVILGASKEIWSQTLPLKTDHFEDEDEGNKEY